MWIWDSTIARYTSSFSIYSRWINSNSPVPCWLWTDPYNERHQQEVLMSLLSQLGTSGWRGKTILQAASELAANHHHYFIVQLGLPVTGRCIRYLFTRFYIIYSHRRYCCGARVMPRQQERLQHPSSSNKLLLFWLCVTGVYMYMCVTAWLCGVIIVNLLINVYLLK